MPWPLRFERDVRRRLRAHNERTKMSTDRDLLENAAKAAGMTVDAVQQAKRDTSGFGDVGLWVIGVSTCWNPLTQDADAMRLSARLRIDLCFDKTHSVSAYTDKDEWFHEHCDQGKTEQIFAKTRRAIVRAAASMLA